MAPNVTCRYCGTVPNTGEVICDSEASARQCAWMGESDWKRYNAAVDKAHAWDAVQKARDVEREHCALIAEKLCDQGRDGYQIAKVIRAGKRTPQETET